MDRIAMPTGHPSKQIDAFNAAVRAAAHKDIIVYHTGPHCLNAPLRRWAMGAYEAGLVLLTKERTDVGFHHLAIRTKRKYHHFVPAAEV